MINVYKTKNIKKYLDEKDFNPNFKKHNIHLKKHFIVAGGTGTGKTNFITNLIANIGVFEHIFVFTADPDEAIYNFLKDELKENFTINKITELIPLQDMPKFNQALIVFDDFICCNKNILAMITTYAIMARKKGFTCSFLTQSYFACPKDIRKNCRYIVLLSMSDKRNTDLVVSTLSVDVESETIKTIIRNATKFKFNVAIIDLQSNDDLNKILRRNFNDFYKVVDDNGESLETIKLFRNNGLLN